MAHRGLAIKSAQSRKSLADILSKPVALFLDSLDLSKSEKTVDTVVVFSWNLHS